MVALRSLGHYRLFSTTTTTSTSTYSLTTSAVKSMCRSEQDLDKAVQIYNNLPHADISPLASRYAQNLIVKRLSNHGRFDDIETLIESHKKHPQITQENYFSTLIRSYGVAGMYDHAFRLFKEMEEVGTPRSSISFNALLFAYNSSEKFDYVCELFDEIPQRYGVSPDEISYGILIKSLCELGSTNSIFSTLKEMGKKNVGVSIITYTTVLDALYKKGKVDKVEKIWNEMIIKGCSPDVPAYNVRMMHAQKPEDALALFDEMTRNGLKPDGASFNLCIVHLCKNGKFEKAYDVFKESVKWNRVPPFSTLQILVEGLVKNSKRKEANELIKTMKEKSPDAWNKLEVEPGLNEDKVRVLVGDVCRWLMSEYKGLKDLNWEDLDLDLDPHSSSTLGNIIIGRSFGGGTTANP